jgi:hypothetical protein
MPSRAMPERADKQVFLGTIQTFIPYSLANLWRSFLEAASKTCMVKAGVNNWPLGLCSADGAERPVTETCEMGVQFYNHILRILGMLSTSISTRSCGTKNNTDARKHAQDIHNAIVVRTFQCIVSAFGGVYPGGPHLLEIGLNNCIWSEFFSQCRPKQCYA